MILTEKFVYIHQPKTGGTFVTKMLKRLYQNQILESRVGCLIAKTTGILGDYLLDTTRYKTKHSGCRQIPLAFRNKPIFATIRNPYDRNVSEYEFGWWKMHPEYVFFSDQLEEVKQVYPHFPKISFYEFIEMRENFCKSSRRLKRLGRSDLIGNQTYNFIKMFSKESIDKALRNVSQEYIDLKKIKEDIFPIHFIKKEYLNQELYNFLVSLGYDLKKIKFILDAKKVLPIEGGREKNQAWEKYYTPELKGFVRRKENLLFSLFPEYDI